MNTSIRTLALTLLIGIVATPASATVIIYGYQDGSDVTFSGGGTLDLTGLGARDGTLDLSGFFKGTVEASEPELAFLDAEIDSYLSAATTVAGAFGAGSLFVADIVSGDAFGFEGAALYTPTGYTSGATLAASMSFFNQTLASMGLVTGEYT